MKDGDPITNYYPAVVPLSLWQKVQDARMANAQSKFGEALHGGRNKIIQRSTAATPTSIADAGLADG